VRSGRPLALAVVCALLGGVAALALGKATGWVGSSSTTTVFRASPLSNGSAAPAAVGPSAKPLPGNGFDPRKIYTGRSAGVVTIFAQYGNDAASAQVAQGSGFVVSPQGYILTNSHVITNAGEGEKVKAADKVYVEFQDRDRESARIVGWDVFDDVGLIQVDPAVHEVDPVPLGNSATVSVGEPVAAIGSPFGNENSLGVGVVSATHRSIDSLTSRYSLVDAIQTDAPINHGNSGGPLFDARGRVIGINAQIRSDSGTAEGVGFAVPINSAKRSMEQLIGQGAVSYAYVGIVTTSLTPSLAKRFGYSVSHGAAITKVEPDSPAAAAGLRAGRREQSYLGVDFRPGSDVVVEIAGRRVTTSEDLVRIVTERLEPGDRVTFTVLRGRSRVQVPVRLSQRANP
jgi:2-alkenal reductase